MSKDNLIGFFAAFVRRPSQSGTQMHVFKPHLPGIVLRWHTAEWKLLVTQVMNLTASEIKSTISEWYSTKHLPWPQDDQSWQASDFQTPTPNPHTARTHTHTPSYYTRVLVPTLSARASELIQLQPKQLWAVFPYPCGFLCWILPAELNGYFNHWLFWQRFKVLSTHTEDSGLQKLRSKI